MEEIKQENLEKYKEYLEPGVVSIVACVESSGNLNTPALSGDDVEQVDLYESPDKSRQNGFIKNGHESYVISPINNKSKFSLEYADCTGIVAVGIDMSTSDNVSFMSHQNPEYFLSEDREAFLRDLRFRLSEIKEKCRSGTIDAVIFGGRFANVKQFASLDGFRDHFKDEYLQSIRLLSEEIKLKLGFSPDIISGPKFDPAQDHVAFDNKTRRLYLARKVDEPGFIQSFNAEDLDKVKDSWKPGEWGLPA